MSLNNKEYRIRVLDLPLLILSVLLSSSACSFIDPLKKGDGYAPNYDMTQLPISDLYTSGQAMGTITEKHLNEISGIVFGSYASDHFWGHNDSGNDNLVFLIRDNGTLQLTCILSGIENRDWEDIAFGAGPDPDKGYLYVAEFGDNYAQYPYKHIYRFAEPDVSTLTDEKSIFINDIDVITFVYEDNRNIDAETLLVDPWTNDIYIVTKREFPVTVYKLPFPHEIGDTLVAKKVGTLPFTAATGGDISRDGKSILIKNYSDVFLWSRNEGEPIDSAFVRPPLKLNYNPEPQGEAIAFTPEGSGYYTVSEIRNNVLPVVYFYKKN